MSQRAEINFYDFAFGNLCRLIYDHSGEMISFVVSQIRASETTKAFQSTRHPLAPLRIVLCLLIAGRMSTMIFIGFICSRSSLDKRPETE